MTTSIRSDATKSVIQVNGVDQLAIGSQGELYANHGADAGTAGQVLTSGGAGQPAVWGDSSGVGIGQTWQNLTGSRAFATTYTNTTGKPIEVSVHANQTAGATSLILTIDGLNVSQFQAVVGITVAGIVPPGKTYSVAAVNMTLALWAELR